MSLLVWLPLLGNLNNQGVDNATFSYVNNNGKLAANNSGKIGKCYERTASGYADTIRSSKNFNLSGDITMACWAYVSATIGDTANGLITNHNHSNNSGVGITVKQISTSDYRISCNTGTGSSRTHATYYGTTNIKDKWCHLALTYSKNNKQLLLYVNGVVEYTLNNYSNGSADNPFDLFNWSTGYYTNGDYRPVCKLNDVRLYDECLSQKQIKEIVKGLVVHYPLNQATSINNLIRNSTYAVYNNYASSGSTGTLVATGENYDGCAVYRLTYTPNSTSLSNVQTALYSHGVCGFNRTFSANTKYCFWILYKPISHPDTVVGGTASNIRGWTEIPSKSWGGGWKICGQYRNGSVTSDKTDQIFVSFKTPSATAGTPITIDFCCPHLVQGYDYILPEFDYAGTNPTTEYDTSGYGYNGTISGTIKSDSDTPKYESSSYIQSGSGVFAHPSITLSQFTISFWAKHTAKEKMVFGSNASPSSTNATWYWYGDNSFKFPLGEFYYSHNAGSADSLLNKWTYFVAVYNGSNVTIYRNGINEGNKSFTGTVTLDYLSVGNGYPGSSYWENSNMSDFRLYATALSANDVKELYQTSTSIDNKGNIYSLEFKEV